MAKGQLISTLYLSVDGDVRKYGPGDDVPEDVARRIGAHAWEGGVHPYPESGKHSAGKASSDATPPPKAGPGSSRDEWVAYAEKQGAEVPEGATREQIIVALAEAGVPVE